MLVSTNSPEKTPPFASRTGAMKLQNIASKNHYKSTNTLPQKASHLYVKNKRTSSELARNGNNIRQTPSSHRYHLELYSSVAKIAQIQLQKLENKQLPGALKHNMANVFALYKSKVLLFLASKNLGFYTRAYLLARWKKKI